MMHHLIQGKYLEEERSVLVNARRGVEIITIWIYTENCKIVCLEIKMSL
jgi:hypothetical protein